MLVAKPTPIKQGDQSPLVIGPARTIRIDFKKLGDALFSNDAIFSNIRAIFARGNSQRYSPEDGNRIFRRIRNARLATFQQAIAEKVIQFLDGQNLFAGLLPRVLHAPKRNRVAANDDVATSRVVVARLPNAANID